MKVIILVTLTCAIINTAYGAKRKRITFEQAAALTLVATTVEGTPRSGLMNSREDYSDRQINSQRFINFELYTPNGQGFSRYTVDFYTGDVFDTLSLQDSCAMHDEIPGESEIKNKKLEAIQKKIRYALHLTHIMYHDLKTKKSRCKEGYHILDAEY